MTSTGILHNFHIGGANKPYDDFMAQVSKKSAKHNSEIKFVDAQTAFETFVRRKELHELYDVINPVGIRLELGKAKMNAGDFALATEIYAEAINILQIKKGSLPPRRKAEEWGSPLLFLDDLIDPITNLREQAAAGAHRAEEQEARDRRRANVAIEANLEPRGQPLLQDTAPNPAPSEWAEESIERLAVNDALSKYESLQERLTAESGEDERWSFSTQMIHRYLESGANAENFDNFTTAKDFYSELIHILTLEKNKYYHY